MSIEGPSRGSHSVENDIARQHQAIVLVVGDHIGHAHGLKDVAQEHAADTIGAGDRIAMGDIGLRGNKQSRAYKDLVLMGNG